MPVSEYFSSSLQRNKLRQTASAKTVRGRQDRQNRHDNRKRFIPFRQELHLCGTVRRLYFPNIQYPLYRHFGQRRHGERKQRGNGYDADNEHL